MTLEETVRKLAEANIAFSIHYPTDMIYVVTVKESLNTEQLKMVVELGGTLSNSGIVEWLGDL